MIPVCDVQKQNKTAKTTTTSQQYGDTNQLIVLEASTETAFHARNFGDWSPGVFRARTTLSPGGQCRSVAECAANTVNDNSVTTNLVQ